MPKRKHNIENLDMTAIYEKSLEIIEENKRYGLKFDMGKDLKAYIKEKKRLEKEKKSGL